MSKFASNRQIAPTGHSVDARREQRFALLRYSTIVAERTRGFCIVRNISTGGMMISTSLPLAIGDVVELELTGGGTVTGKVRWRQGDCMGIQSQTPIILSEVLSNPEWKRWNGVRRMPRLVIEGAAKIWIGETELPARTSDISTNGARLVCHSPVALGPVRIELDGLSSLEGSVLWVQGNQIGCVFLNPIPLPDLSRWADAQSSSSVSR